MGACLDTRRERMLAHRPDQDEEDQGADRAERGVDGESVRDGEAEILDRRGHDGRKAETGHDENGEQREEAHPLSRADQPGQDDRGEGVGQAPAHPQEEARRDQDRADRPGLAVEEKRQGDRGAGETESADPPEAVRQMAGEIDGNQGRDGGREEHRADRLLVRAKPREEPRQHEGEAVGSRLQEDRREEEDEEKQAGHAGSDSCGGPGLV
jgi:hypothetical protein